MGDRIYPLVNLENSGDSGHCLSMHFTGRKYSKSVVYAINGGEFGSTLPTKISCRIWADKKALNSSLQLLLVADYHGVDETAIGIRLGDIDSLSPNCWSTVLLKISSLTLVATRFDFFGHTPSVPFCLSNLSGVGFGVGDANGSGTVKFSNVEFS